MTKHVLGYVRVSTEEQADSRLGIEAQLNTIQTECDRRGWSVEMHVDAGCSGKQVNPQLRGALDLLSTGQADGLVVAKLDRLARSVLHAAEIMESADRQGWALTVLDLDVDLSTAQGKAMAGMLNVFAQFERDMISTRTKEALAAKIRRGEPVGRKPATPPGVVRRIVIDREAGLSFRNIASNLTAEDVLTPTGRRVWQESTVRRTYATATRNAEAAA
jgi:DNA invertase Pin-like site-specific DNA recombinase